MGSHIRENGQGRGEKDTKGLLVIEVPGFAFIMSPLPAPHQNRAHMGRIMGHRVMDIIQ